MRSANDSHPPNQNAALPDIPGRAVLIEDETEHPPEGKLISNTLRYYRRGGY